MTLTLTVTPTQAQVDALLAAIAAGVTEVSHNGKTTRYSSVAEMTAALQALLRWSATGTDRPSVVYLRNTRDG